MPLEETKTSYFQTAQAQPEQRPSQLRATRDFSVYVRGQYQFLFPKGARQDQAEEAELYTFFSMQEAGLQVAQPRPRSLLITSPHQGRQIAAI